MCFLLGFLPGMSPETGRGLAHPSQRPELGGAWLEEGEVGPEARGGLSSGSLELLAESGVAPDVQGHLLS